MTSSLFCISSRKRRVSPGTTGTLKKSESLAAMLFTSRLPLKNSITSGFLSTLTSKKYLKLLPKCRMVLDLPTCRAPLTKRGFLRGLSFHSSKAWSMLLDKYLSISLRLFDYMAAKILIINDICNYFMLTLLKDRVMKGHFVTKDRVIIGYFLIKDRVIRLIQAIIIKIISVKIHKNTSFLIIFYYLWSI